MSSPLLPAGAPLELMKALLQAERDNDPDDEDYDLIHALLDDVDDTELVRVGLFMHDAARSMATRPVSRLLRIQSSVLLEAFERFTAGSDDPRALAALEALGAQMRFSEDQRALAEEWQDDA